MINNYLDLHGEVSSNHWNEAFQNLFLVKRQIFLQCFIASDFVFFLDETTELQSASLLVFVFNCHTVSPVRSDFSIVNKTFQQFQDLDLVWLEASTINDDGLGIFWWFLAFLWL